MRSLSLRSLYLCTFVFVTVSAFAHDVTITGTQSFASLDGSSADHDGVANGVFTVSDGNLVVNGVVNCNDDGASVNACPMAFAVSGNMTINSGGALYAENRTGSGIGGAITLTVGGNLALNGTAIVSTDSKSSSGSTGGAITANVGGSVALASGTTIDAGASNARGGDITIAAGSVVSVDGNVLSGPSRTILSTRQTDVALDGGTANQIGGAITIGSSTFVEPALVVGTNANIISQGGDGGAGPVRLDGCGIQIRGLIAALSRKDSAAQISIRSGKDVLVDGRDLGASGTRMGRVRADAPTGTAVNKGVDIFAAETVDLLGPAGSLFAITSTPGLHDSKSYGGRIRVISLGDAVNASGRVIDNGHTASGDSGGIVQISAKGDVNLNTAVIESVGDFSTNNANRGGGSVSARSYSGNVIWTSGTGDVRPVGSTSGLTPAEQGSIVLTACGTVNTTGSSFPSNGTPTSPLPETHTGVCSPAAPSLPVGVPPLVTCNTPPVANDTAATTNEDTAVTITMTGSDADGDSLTFSIVSGPSHGTLGPVVFVNATTSTVTYTPALNYNGGDSFVFRANDGNGGTDDATATITILPVNDPPSFLAGPTITVLEDAGAQSFTNWATAISPGPSDESAQTVTFTVTNDNPSLFTVQPAVSSTGTLTFTAVTNAFGSANITVTAHDNGGTLNGGNDTSAPQTSSITVTAVNDEPSFVKGPDQTVNEDAGAQSVANWATSISAGPNEGGQSLTFVTSNDNNALFSAQPSVSASGTLTYTPAANANGSATVIIYLMDNGGTANGGDDTSPAQTFTITVNSVNDAPSFTSGGDVTVDEDSGAYSAAWATAISAGPANESSQTVSFNVSNSNNALFSVQPSVSSTGVLSFTPAADANGSATVTVAAQDNGGTANGGVDTSASQTFTINVNSVNDAPSFTPGADQTSNEDAGPQSVAWATGISAGPANESGQTVSFVASNDNNALFSAQPAIASNGTLTYTAAANANGTATVTVYAQDNGGTANGGDDTSASSTFTITIVAVNDAPSFTGGGNVTVLEDSGAYSAAWATAINAGAADESGQTLTFNIVSNSNPSLFATGPSISSSGVLSFSPAANAFGSATLVITLSDNGGTANGGADTSAPYTFTITVTPVNDAPSFTPGGDVTVNEDGGPYSAPWASGISAGPNEAGQTVAFLVSNSNNALFAVQPSISPAGVLTFTTALNAFGSATVTVSLQDNGGTANGGVDTSAPVTFTITVNAVNDPPTAVTDTWDTLGNTELRVDLPGGLTPKVADTTPSGNGVRDNDSDPEGDPSVVTGIVGCSDVTAPFDCTLGDGSKVSMLANGSFSYTPGPGNTSGSFQYTITDIPAAGLPASSTGTVNITIYDRIWYVNGSAVGGGNGTSISPFNSFVPVNGAGDADVAGDTIFVHTSVVSGFIAMEANEKLWGEGVGLSTTQNLNGNGSPQVIVAPGVRPTVVSGPDTVTVTGVTGADIAGLSLSSSFGNGINVTSLLAGPGASATIRENVIAGAAQEGIEVNADSASGTTVSVSNTSITAAGNGFDVASGGPTVVSYDGGTIRSTGGIGIRMDGSVSGNLTVAGLANVTIDGITAGSGISIVAAKFDSVPGGAFNTVNAGTIAVGSIGDPVGGAGVVMSNVSGDVAFGTLTVFGGSTGVTIGGSGLYTGSAGMRVTSGGGSISAPAGVALSVTNATIGAANLNFTSISSTAGANGIALSNTDAVGGLVVSGTGSAGSGGTIQTASGDGISLSNTQKLSLSRMNVTNNLGSGIRGTTVRGFVLNNCSISGNGDSAVTDESGINITDLTGTGSAGTHPTAINGTTVSNNYEFEVQIANSTGTLTDLQMNNCIVSSTGASGSHGNLVNFLTTGAATATLNVNGGSFTGNAPATATAIHVDASGGTITANVTGATLMNNNVGVNVSTALSGNLTFDVHDNPLITGNRSHALNVFAAANTTGAVSGKFRNNLIGTAGVAGSGSQLGFGVRVQNEALASMKVLISGNTIQELANFAAINVNHGIVGSPLANTTAVTISNNIIRNVNNSRAIIVQANATSGSSSAGTVCLDLAGNDMAGIAGNVGDGTKIRIRQLAGSTFNVRQKAATAAVDPQELDDANSVGANVTTPAQVSASGTFNYNAGACPQP
jgi:hypothetical protein